MEETYQSIGRELIGRVVNFLPISSVFSTYICIHLFVIFIVIFEARALTPGLFLFCIYIELKTKGNSIEGMLTPFERQVWRPPLLAEEAINRGHFICPPDRGRFVRLAPILVLPGGRRHARCERGRGIIFRRGLLSRACLRPWSRALAPCGWLVCSCAHSGLSGR